MLYTHVLDLKHGLINILLLSFYTPMCNNIILHKTRSCYYIRAAYYTIANQPYYIIIYYTVVNSLFNTKVLTRLILNVPIKTILI